MFTERKFCKLPLIIVSSKSGTRSLSVVIVVKLAKRRRLMICRPSYRQRQQRSDIIILILWWKILIEILVLKLLWEVSLILKEVLLLIGEWRNRMNWSRLIPDVGIERFTITHSESWRLWNFWQIFCFASISLFRFRCRFLTKTLTRI